MTPATPLAVGDIELQEGGRPGASPQALQSDRDRAALGQSGKSGGGCCLPFYQSPPALKQGHLDSEGQPRAKHTHCPLVLADPRHRPCADGDAGSEAM